METVRTTEQKIKVGDININYVRSVIDGGNHSKTLLCLPGAMGNKKKLFEDCESSEIS